MRRQTAASQCDDDPGQRVDRRTYALPIRFVPREAPCTGCGVLVALKIIIHAADQRDLLVRQLPIHEDDGTPADRACQKASSRRQRLA
jgi:hypothetical protein